MIRVLFPFLLAVLLLAPLARAGEPQSPTAEIDPVEVGRLLLSEDEGERARGLALLTRRIEQGGKELPAFLAAMASEQEAWANAEERLVARWIRQALHGTEEEKARARRLLAAIGPKGTALLLAAIRQAEAKDAPVTPSEPAGVPPQVAEAERVPEPDSAPAAPAPAPAPAPPTPSAVVPPPPPRAPAEVPPPPPRPEWPVEVEVILAPRAEFSRWTKNGHPDFAKVLGGRAVAVNAAANGRLFESLARLPDARSYLRRRAGTSVGSAAPLHVGSGADVMLLEGGRVLYRRDVRRTKTGAWAIEDGEVPNGLQVRLQTAPGGEKTLRFTLEARHVDVRAPFALEEKRPAPDVEPVVLDVPEWEVSSMSTSIEADPRRVSVLALFPQIVEGKVVAVSLRSPLPAPEAATREGAGQMR